MENGENGKWKMETGKLGGWPTAKAMGHPTLDFGLWTLEFSESDVWEKPVKLQPESHWTRQMEVALPRRRNRIAHQIIDGEAVLYDPQSRHTHRMNQTALWVWQACDGRSTTRQLARRLTKAYEVPFDTALEDVEQSLAAFAQAGLVTPAEER